MAADWPGITVDMLLLIAEKTMKNGSVCDVISMTAVCSKWRSCLHREEGWMSRTLMALIGPDYNISLPVLMLPERVPSAAAGDPNKRDYYDLDSEIYFRLHLPELRGSRCCGSGYGWLVFVCDDGFLVRLLNPLTNQLIELQEIPFCRVDSEGNICPFKMGKYPMNRYMTKAIIMANPSTQKDYTIAAIVSKHIFWLINGLNGKIWLKVPTVFKPTDIAYCGDVVYSFVEGVFPTLEAWNVRTRRFMWLQNWKLPIPTKISSIRFRSYLVQNVGGGIYAVLRPVLGVNTRLPPKVSVYVYRFVEEDERWVRVMNLGESSFFVSDNTCMALSQIPRDSFFKKNHVYFTRSYIFPPETGGLDWGVYSMAKETYQIFSFVNAGAYSLAPSVWVRFNPSRAAWILPDC